MQLLLTTPKLLKIIDDYELAQYNFPELANEIETEETTETTTKLVVDTPIINAKPLNKPIGIAQSNASNEIGPLPTKQLPLASIDSIKKESPIPTKTIQQPAPIVDTPIAIQTSSTIKTEIAQPQYNYPEGRFRINQVPVILGKQDMSFVEIALKYNVPLYKLFEYNEINQSVLLERDQLIFLAPKKKAGATSFHIAKSNTSLHEISQLEGIQLNVLKAYNPQLGATVDAGTQVLLFKSKETPSTNKKDNTLLFNKKN